MKKKNIKFKNLFTIPDQDLEIIHLIFSIRKELNKHVNQKVDSEYNLTNSQIEALASLHYSDIQTSTDLAQKLNVSKANLTGIINQLIKKDLVTKTQSEEDARSNILKTTEKGAEEINKIVPQFITFMSDTLSSVKECEKASLEKNLLLILTSLEKKNS